MIRQYVGARYVPKFASPIDWKSGTSYEAMTIVAYNNSSYTSKVPVPATVGNPANNPQYWALTGNYNAQVEEYRQDVINNTTELNTTINNLKTETENSVQQVQEQTNEIQSNLAQEINDRKKKDEELEKNFITPYGMNHRKILIIGDSYTASKEWTGKLPDYGLGVTENKNMIIQAIGGAGFTVGDKFKDQLTLAQTKVTAAGLNADDITDIYYCGCVNDGGTDASTITSAINDCITAASNMFKNAEQYVVPFGSNISGIARWNFVRNFIQGAHSSNANVAKNAPMILHSPDLFQSDGLHPSNDGMSLIAHYMAKFIKGSDELITPYRTAGVTNNNGTIGGNTFTFCNSGTGQLVMRWTGMEASYTDHITFNYNTNTVIGQMTKTTLLLPNYVNDTILSDYIPVRFYVNHDTTKVYTGFLTMLKTDDANVYNICIFQQYPYFQKISDVSSITIEPVEHILTY